jgi:hypothetical protein
MRSGILMIGAGLLLLVTAASSSAAVNCKQVKKYLDTGRSVKDVAETMVIDESEVRKCMEQGGGQAGAAEGKSAEPKAGESKGAQPKPED